MKPLQLKISAFGPFNEEVNLDFSDLKDHQLFLINGPTGAGKTSILDAIVYALYGSTSGTNRSGEQMRSDYADDSRKTEVDFQFAIGNESYRIQRTPKQELKKQRGEGTKVYQATVLLERWKEGAWETIASKANDVQAAILEIIGFRQDQFTQVVLLPQGDFRKLLHASSGDRAKILRDLFNTTVYKRMQDLLKEDYNAVKEELEKQVEREKTLFLEESVANWEELENKLSTLKADLASAQKNLKRVETEKNQIEDRYKSAAQKETLQQSIVAQETRLKELEMQKDAMAELEKKVIRSKHFREIEPLWKQVKEGRSDFASEEKSLQRLEGELERWKAEAVALVNRRKDWDAGEEGRKQLARDINLLATNKKNCDSYNKVVSDLEKEMKAYEAAQNKSRTCEKAQLDIVVAEEKQKEERKLLQQQIEDTAGAAAKASALQGQLTERKRRNRLLKTIEKEEGDLKELETALEQAKNASDQKKKIYEGIYKSFFQNQAYYMSQDLQEGTPCPVCGSQEHPHKAEIPHEIWSEDDVKSAEEDYKKAHDLYMEKQSTYGEKRSRCTESRIALDDLEKEEPLSSEEDLGVLIKACEKEKDLFHEAKERLDQLGKEAEVLNRRKEKVDTDYKEAVKASTTVESRIKALEEQKANFEKSLSEEERYLEYWEQRTQLLEAEATQNKLLETRLLEDERDCLNHVTQKTAAIESTKKNMASLTTKIEQKTKDLMEQMEMHNFREDELSQWEGWSDEFNDWEESLESYKSEWQNVTIAKKTLDEEWRRIPEDEKSLAELTEEKEKVSKAHEEALQKKATDEVNLKTCEKHRKDILRVRQDNEKNKERARFLNRLYSLANGVHRQGFGKAGFTFENFVLRTILEEVLVAANMRLRDMSQNRYSLQKAELRESAQGYQGLDLEVFDAYTGYERDVRTLSGGETFIASLALALGMADIIQSYAGGIFLDTIFIDEGFGTLDPETLDQALDVLIKLQSGGRLVGVISHVPELKERIEAKLDVIKTDQGSRAQFSL